MDEFYVFIQQFWIVWGVLLFAAILFWALRPKNKKRFERDANMIFDDERGEDK